MEAHPPFLGRSEELEILQETYRSDRSSLVVVHGRRRIGKSRLVQQFAKDKPFLEFEALEGERTAEQIRHFTTALARQTKDPLLRSASFRSWDEAFTFLAERVLPGHKRKLVLFLDEFQWMAAGRGKLVALIKYFWDNRWKQSNVMLVLCGSISSFMVDRVIRSKALYGRISLEICLRGLPPAEAKLMFRGRRGNEEILKYLMVLGGVPRYLEEIRLDRSFPQNMNRLCFSPEGLLVTEFDKIFHSQFREHRTYLRIVQVLRERALSLSQVAGQLGLPSGGGLKRYLDNLILAEIVDGYRPFGKPDDSRERKYRLVDEYILFYSKYIAPNLKTIRTSTSRKLFERLCGPSLDAWSGLAFERFCVKHATALARAMGFEDEVLDASPYFRKDGEGFQIDLLFQRSDRVVTLCEVKHHDAPIDTKIIPEVERKCRLLPLRRGMTLERALVSVHGPGKSLRDAQYFHHYVTLDDLLQPAARC